MDGEVPELKELARLTQAYRQAIEDVASMPISDIERVARLLEIEARYLGAIAACREAVEKRQKIKTGPH